MKPIVTVLTSIVLSVGATIGVMHFMQPKYHEHAEVHHVKDNIVFDRIMKTKTIHCGYVISPPHLMKDASDGTLSGIAYEVMEKMAANLGLDVDWAEETGWETMLEGMGNRYDMLCSAVWATTSRALKADALNPLDFAGVNIWVRADDTRFNGDLNALDWTNIKIATIDGHISDIIALNDFPGAQKLSLPDITPISEIFTAVADGKADVAFEENHIGYEFMKHNPGKITKADHAPLRLFSTSFLIPQGEEKLKAMLNLAQAELVNSGFVARAIEKYEAYPDSFYRAAKPYEAKE